MIAIACGKTCSVLAPQVLKRAIDDLTIAVTVEKLAFYGAVIVGIAMGAGFFRYWMRKLIIGVSRFIEYDLRKDFFEHLQHMSLSFYGRWRTGDLMSRASNDITAVRMVLGPGVMYPAETVMIAIGALTFMFVMNVELTLCALLVMPVLTIVVKRFGALIHKRFEAIQEKMSDISVLVQENITGMRVVRAYVQEDHEVIRFNKENEEYFERNMRLVRLWGAFYPLLASLIGLVTALVLWWGGRLVIEGVITLGELVAFFAYLAMLMRPMIAFGWVVNLYQRGSASMNRIAAILDEKSEFGTEKTTLIKEVTADTVGRIEFRAVSYRYPDTEEGKRNQGFVLQDINLVIEPGQTVAFVGRTGSGKSTLMSLVPRLYDVSAGMILLDGQDVRTLPLARLRAAVGFVPQDSFLFSESIRDNIAFGQPESSDEEVVVASRIAGLDTDIKDFQNGYATMVGERGITLSGGQRQRAAIARALVVDPPILVLDDVLSSVDTETEDRILSALRGVIRKRTTLLVSHRTSTVKDADLICFLEHGRIVERGHHNELVNQDGLYAALHQKQLLEEELSAI